MQQEISRAYGTNQNLEQRIANQDLLCQNLHSEAQKAQDETRNSEYIAQEKVAQLMGHLETHQEKEKSFW